MVSMLRKSVVLLMLFAPMLALGQKSSDTDKQKITDIEQKFASISNFNSPEMTDAMQKYLYDGTTVAVNQFGRSFRMPKSQVVDMTKKPDPSDPDAKAQGKISDLQVDVLGDTALASYKLVNTETGHKEAALNADFTLTCLDSFAKRKGQWYIIGTACVPAEPLSQSQWDAVMRMRAAEKPQ
jgi:hypothetical protein